MIIADRTISPVDPPYVIAEIGVNHDGNPDRARRLIEAAREAGADAVKLQWFETDLLLSAAAPLAAYQERSGEPDAHAMLRRLELPRDAYADLLDHAHAVGLHAIATIFSLELVRPATALAWDAFKIASPDLINRPLIEALATRDRPLILSTGGSTLDEVERARDWTASADVAFLQCVSAYPTPDEQASLGAIPLLRRRTGRPIGYSDHTRGVDTGALAVAAGARILEKHLTWASGVAGPDHAASLEADRFAEYVALARRAHLMLGPAAKSVLEVERPVRDVARQSVAAARSVPAGRPLTRDDLTILRPGAGLPPDRLESLIGRALARPVEPGEIIRASDIAGEAEADASAA